MTKNEKPLLVILEGAQGSAKTTTSNYLRENITSTNLLRLSGTKSNSTLMSFKHHREIFDMCRRMGEIGIDNNIVFDRSFLSEWCYVQLGYKGSNTKEFDGFGITLSYLLEELTRWYNVIVIPLVVGCEKEYQHRLERSKAEYAFAPFDARKSMSQEAKYIELVKELKYRAPSIKVLPVNTVFTSLEKIKELIIEV